MPGLPPRPWRAQLPLDWTFHPLPSLTRLRTPLILTMQPVIPVTPKRVSRHWSRSPPAPQYFPNRQRMPRRGEKPLKPGAWFEPFMAIRRHPNPGRAFLPEPASEFEYNFFRGFHGLSDAFDNCNISPQELFTRHGRTPRGAPGVDSACVVGAALFPPSGGILKQFLFAFFGKLTFFSKRVLLQ
jgi:hypothetical protein